jgi:hypothetical protein
MVTDTLENLAQTWLKLVRSQTRLFLLEAKLARNSIMPFLGLVLLLIVLIACLCIVTLSVILYGIYFLNGNLLFSLLLVELICIVSCLVVVWLCLRFYRQLQFSKTRRHLKAQTQKMTLPSQEQSDE